MYVNKTQKLRNKNNTKNKNTMRKVLFGLGAILMCVLLSSCGNPLSKLQSLADDMAENGKDWDEDQWESVLRDAAELELAFWESEPTKEEIKEYDKLDKVLSKAVKKATKSKKSEKALEKAYKALMKDKEFKELLKDGEKAEKKARKAAKKSAKDDDEDDDDDEEEDDDDDE